MYLYLRTRLLLLLGGDANHVEDEQKEIVDPAQPYQRCHRTKVPSAQAAQLVLAAEPQPGHCEEEEARRRDAITRTTSRASVWIREKSK